jgi:hypothetical protein
MIKNFTKVTIFHLQHRNTHVMDIIRVGREGKYSVLNSYPDSLASDCIYGMGKAYTIIRLVGRDLKGN